VSALTTTVEDGDVVTPSPRQGGQRWSSAPFLSLCPKCSKTRKFRKPGFPHDLGVQRDAEWIPRRPRRRTDAGSCSRNEDRVADVRRSDIPVESVVKTANKAGQDSHSRTGWLVTESPRSTQTWGNPRGGLPQESLSADRSRFRRKPWLFAVLR
jgi:hypothetical protein